ncbi:hypothetical protein A2U01_0087457, partial [Trifolium medium]|nr:hypothetical protein [Trifolium medium]
VFTKGLCLVLSYGEQTSRCDLDMLGSGKLLYEFPVEIRTVTD